MRTLIVALLAIALVSCSKFNFNDNPMYASFDYEAQKQSVVQITSDYTHGTGFVIAKDSEATYMMTAGHVVPETLMVGFYILPSVYYYVDEVSGNRNNVEVVWRSEFQDVAIVKTLHDNDLKPVKFAEKEAERGDRVFNISFPQMFRWSYSEGYVMANPATFTGMYQGHAKRIFPNLIIQVSLPVSNGSSGSAIFNERGEVIGMVNVALGDCDITAGLNLESLKIALAEYEVANGEDAE